MFFRGSRYENISGCGDRRHRTGERSATSGMRFIPETTRAAHCQGGARRPAATSLASARSAIPEQFWRLCDINRMRRPADLTAVRRARILRSRTGKERVRWRLSLLSSPSRSASRRCRPPFFQALREIEVETAIGRHPMSGCISTSAATLGRFRRGRLRHLPAAGADHDPRLGRPGLPQALINAFVTDTRLAPATRPARRGWRWSAMDALGTLMTTVNSRSPGPTCPPIAHRGGDFRQVRDDPGHSADCRRHATSSKPRPSSAHTTRASSSTRRAQRLRALHPARSGARHATSVISIGRSPLMPPQGVLSIDFGRQSNLTHFAAPNDMLRPTSASAECRSILAPPRAGARPRRRRRPNYRWARAHAVPRSAAADRSPRDGCRQPAPKDAQGTGANATRDQPRALGARARSTALKFERPLRTGLPVMVRGAGRQNNGPYYVQSVTHKHFARRLPPEFHGLAQCRGDDRRRGVHRSPGAGGMRGEASARRSLL